MNATKAELAKELARAKAYGWDNYFKEAAETITKGFFDAYDLMGIASRETNLDSQWLTRLGDGGHAGGLMQVDVRYFPDFVKSGEWKDARQGILKGAEILMQKWHDVQSGIGQHRTVKSSKSSGVYPYVGKDVGQGAEAQAVTIAAYNCGGWSHYAVSNNQDVDKYSTGHDYSADAIARAKVFRELNSEPLAQPSAPISPDTTEDTQSLNPTVPEAPTVKGDAPDVPPVQVTQNSFVSKLTAGIGGTGALITAAWGFLTSNPSTAGIGFICLTVIILAVMDRWKKTDVVRMQIAADPDKRNVT